MNKFLKIFSQKYFILIFVILANYWFWKMIKADFFIALAVVFQSLLTFKFVYDKKVSFYLTILVFAVLFLAAFFLLKNNFDKNLLILNPTEKERFNLRHNYFARDLGKFYTNKFSLYYYVNLSTFVYKFQKNLFLNLDPNLYFFAGHPRERGDADNFDKYSSLLLPFFILGIIWAFSKKSRRLLVYLIFVSILSAFLTPNYILGPVLFALVINVLIALGIIKALRYAFKNNE